MLFSKTVGPLKEAFMVYNSQGKSKGMAIVTFARPGDAALARSKYHGKIVDGSEYHPSLTQNRYLCSMGCAVVHDRRAEGVTRYGCGVF